jgi:hypothetical protein
LKSNLTALQETQDQADRVIRYGLVAHAFLFWILGDFDAPQNKSMASSVASTEDPDLEVAWTALNDQGPYGRQGEEAMVAFTCLLGQRLAGTPDSASECPPPPELPEEPAPEPAAPAPAPAAPAPAPAAPTPTPGATATFTGVTFVGQWTVAPRGGDFGNLNGIAVDGTGNGYVADLSKGRIQKFTSTGQFLTAWGAPGSDDGQFKDLRGIAVGGEGHVYVVDAGNSRVQKFTSTGKFLAKWGTPGSSDGQFTGPSGIAVDGARGIYVVDGNNYRVQKFNEDGESLTKWGPKAAATASSKGPAVWQWTGPGTSTWRTPEIAESRSSAPTANSLIRGASAIHYSLTRLPLFSLPFRQSIWAGRCG